MNAVGKRGITNRSEGDDAGYMNAYSPAIVHGT